MILLFPKPAPDASPDPPPQANLPRLISESIQLWLSRLVSRAMAEYAEKKDPRDRSLQSGNAWSTFLQTFGPETSPGLLHIFVGFHRLAREDTPIASLLFGAGFALYLEQDCFARQPRPAAAKRRKGGLASTNSDQDGFALAIPEVPADPAQALLWARQTIERWCDWLDASIHLQTHSWWHHSPVVFDPDPEKRDLACLGIVQRSLAHQPAAVQALWRHFHSGAAEHFKNSPKWLTLGRAMSSNEERPWPYREVDTAIISLWPLLKRHNWTYRDLMNVTRSLISRPDAYPCQREQDFTVHCRTVLGLRKNGRGKSSPDSQPPGHKFAREIYTAALFGFTPLDPQN